MKVFLLYLLIPCLLFIKGNSPVIPGSSKYLQAASGSDKAVNGKDTFIGCWQDAADNGLSPVIIEEDENDEPSPTKKKMQQLYSPQLKNDHFTDDCVTSPVTANRFHKHYCYLSSHRYILHRVIII